MTAYEFIFTDRPAKRLYRHLAFWLALPLHFIIQNLMVGGIGEALKPRSFIDSSFNASFFFPIYILSVYIFINVALPRYLYRGRYIIFFCWIAGLLIFNFIASFYSGLLYVHLTSHISFDKITFDSNKYNVVVNGLFLPIAILGVAGGIKLSKKWHLEQKENERMAKEKISRELQLLKTQLHPRFLFHSLHTLKKHIQTNSSLAANLIMHLSDLLSYILYESDREWVLLEKELEVINSYVDLEKKSSKDRLATEINISGKNASGKYISPLLLLSVVENCFDFFLKDNETDSSLELAVTVEDNRLDYHLSCTGFLDAQNDPGEVKSKFVDIERQLQNLYPALHQFEVFVDEENIT
ncbi:MAG: sensor histidine kinase, partial [Ginsengibacter sp.]